MLVPRVSRGVRKLIQTPKLSRKEREEESWSRFMVLVVVLMEMEEIDVETWNVVRNFCLNVFCRRIKLVILGVFVMGELICQSSYRE